jgi:predicted permease
VAIATGVVFGLAPAWRATRVNAQAAMKTADRTIAEGHSRFTAGKALVVVQITLALVLVMSAGLLLGSFRELATLDPGFRSQGVLLASLDLRNADYPDEQVGAVKREILERLRAAPGVRSASASEITPISGAGWNGGIAVDGFAPRDERDNLVFFNAVAPDFFATLRTPLLAGREFTSSDRSGSVPVAVINEALAKKFFGSRNPLGARIGLLRPGEAETHDFVEVVGIVADTKYGSLREDTRELLYLPMTQSGWNRPGLNVELRTDGAAASLIPTVEAVSAAVSPRISLEFTTLAGQVASSLSRERLLATLSGFFGGLALLLAAVGLYGTLSYNVARRRNEIGIRMALGAASGAVLRSVLREAGVLVVLGLLLGGVAAWASTRFVASFLYGLSPTDATVFVVSVLALVVAAAIAAALPAWRATRVDPMVALRAE